MKPTPQAKPRSCARLVALIVGFLAALAVPASAATVATDKADYAPGENVVITGSGWEPGETVVLILHEDPQLDPDLQLTAYADENGDFTNTDFSVDVFDIGVTFTLSATGGSSGLTAETTFTDAPPVNNCGNGVVDTGEQCDLGAANGSGSCCKMNCSFANAGSTCQHPAGNAGAVCRAAAGECDLAETCTGSSASCPTTDVKKASGIACTDDGNPCTPCQHPAGNAGAVCRAAAGECDLVDTCTGTSATCPADVKKSLGTACTADTNPCTLDQCDGTSNACQHPAGNAGATCRAVAG